MTRICEHSGVELPNDDKTPEEIAAELWNRLPARASVSDYLAGISILIRDAEARGERRGLSQSQEIIVRLRLRIDELLQESCQRMENNIDAEARGERRGLEWAAKHFEAMKNASYSRSDTVSVAFATDAENEIRVLIEETK